MIVLVRSMSRNLTCDWNWNWDWDEGREIGLGLGWFMIWGGRATLDGLL